MLTLCTEVPSDRTLLLAALHGARHGRPLMPFSPLYAGTLLLQRSSLYWTNCHAVLLPSHLLLLRDAEVAHPFRVVTLASTVAYYRDGNSLIISLCSDGWQLNFSARDARALGRWTAAI